MEAAGGNAGWKCRVKWRQRPVNDDRVLLDLVASDREKPRCEVHHLTGQGPREAWDPEQLLTHRALVDITGLYSPEPAELLEDADISGADVSTRSSINNYKLIRRATLRVPLIRQSECSPPTSSGAVPPPRVPSFPPSVALPPVPWPLLPRLQTVVVVFCLILFSFTLTELAPVYNTIVSVIIHTVLILRTVSSGIARVRPSKRSFTDRSSIRANSDDSISYLAGCAGGSPRMPVTARQVDDGQHPCEAALQQQRQGVNWFNKVCRAPKDRLPAELLSKVCTITGYNAVTDSRAGSLKIPSNRPIALRTQYERRASIDRQIDSHKIKQKLEEIFNVYCDTHVCLSAFGLRRAADALKLDAFSRVEVSEVCDFALGQALM